MRPTTIWTARASAAERFRSPDLHAGDEVVDRSRVVEEPGSASSTAISPQDWRRSVVAEGRASVYAYSAESDA